MAVGQHRDRRRVPPFAPYLLKTVGGVKVAVIGVTTPAIPQWEKPENIRGLSWLDPERACVARSRRSRPSSPT